MHLGSSEPVFAGGGNACRPRPFPGVHWVAAAGPQPGGAPRLGFFDLRGNELVAYTRCAQASSRRVEPRRRRRPVRARNKDKRHSCILMAGRARNTDGTHPRASSGARSVVSGPFPEVLPPAWRRASSACDRQDPTEQSRSRPRRRWGRRHAAPRNLGRAGRAFVGLRYRRGIH